MTAPVWLIAEREIRTYVATVSFWVALAIGPLAGGAVLLLSGAPAGPLPITIRADNAQLARPTAAAKAANMHSESLARFSTCPP